MATTVTIPTPSIHWILYPLLIAGVGFGLWAMHDSSVKSAIALKETVAQVAASKSAVVLTDKQVATNDSTAQATLKAQNAALIAQLTTAKSQTSQIALINKQLGTQITQTPSAVNPSSPSITVIPATDLPSIAQKLVDFQEAENQVGADKVEIAGQAQQIETRDTTIKAQDTEITALKGGSKWHKFLKGTEHVLIAGGVGVGIGYALKK